MGDVTAKHQAWGNINNNNGQKLNKLTDGTEILQTN